MSLKKMTMTIIALIALFAISCSQNTAKPQTESRGPQGLPAGCTKENVRPAYFTDNDIPVGITVCRGITDKEALRGKDLTGAILVAGGKEGFAGFDFGTTILSGAKFVKDYTIDNKTKRATATQGTETILQPGEQTKLEPGTGANLEGAIFSSYRTGGPSGAALLDKTDFTGANLTGATFRTAVTAELSTKLGTAILEDTKLVDVNKGSGGGLSHFDLSDVNLKGAILTSANLTNSDLSNAQLVGATLSNADLQNAVLSGANLERNDFTIEQTYLDNTNLKGAVLSNANLHGANLAGAQTDSATKFKGAICQGATWLDGSPAQFVTPKLPCASK